MPHLDRCCRWRRLYCFTLCCQRRKKRAWTNYYYSWQQANNNPKSLDAEDHECSALCNPSRKCSTCEDFAVDFFMPKFVRLLKKMFVRFENSLPNFQFLIGTAIAIAPCDRCAVWRCCKGVEPDSDEHDLFVSWFWHSLCSERQNEKKTSTCCQHIDNANNSGGVWVVYSVFFCLVAIARGLCPTRVVSTRAFPLLHLDAFWV